MTTPYDVPLGEGTGTYEFRLMPTDEFEGGTLMLGLPGEDGAVTAAWVDSWHQRDVVSLTGIRTATGATVAYEYAPGWTWEIEVAVDAGNLSLVMRNGVPASEDGPATRYDAMRASWS
jgi:hypothetical protein